MQNYGEIFKRSFEDRRICLNRQYCSYSSLVNAIRERRNQDIAAVNVKEELIVWDWRNESAKHFSHRLDSNCKGGYPIGTSIHLFGKQILEMSIERSITEY
jgi:hypothetical protein